MSTTPLDILDRQLIDLLKVNARLPVVKLAKALESSGVITGYTIGVSTPQRGPGIRAMVLISIDSKCEHEIIQSISRRHEVRKLFSVSGRYDLCAMLSTDSTEELDSVIDRFRAIKGVVETFSTIMLSTKLDRPD